MNISSFIGEGGGLGRMSLQRWIAAGGSESEFARQAMGRSDLSKGWRVQEDISRIIANDAQRAAAAESERDSYQSQISDYRNQLSNYQNQLTNYQSQFNDLTSQYNDALGSASKFENMFNEKSAEYEAARDEAQRYRDEAVGRQLQTIRSGATTGGDNQTQGGIASLAAGRAGVRKADDRAVEIEKKIQAESGALTGKGPVVQRIQSSRPSGRASSNSQRQVNPAGTSSYYASRFR